MLSKACREMRAVSLRQRGLRKSEIGMRGHASGPWLRPAGLRPPQLRPPKYAVRRPQFAGIKTSIALLTGNYRDKRVTSSITFTLPSTFPVGQCLTFSRYNSPLPG
jgi:hypothetical protein